MMLMPSLFLFSSSPFTLICFQVYHSVLRGQYHILWISLTVYHYLY
jgi:hypothetical protein